MKAVVLGSDSGYLEKAETVIKSVCAHNRDIVFYVLNDDLPSEWFDVMNSRLAKIGSRIVNAKITDHPLKNFDTPAAIKITYAAYFRYYIPRFVMEPRALYLDTDTIVNGPLDDLFETDLEGYMVGAVQDVSSWGMLGGFNSGVLLIDTDAWRRENVLDSLIELTKEHHQHVYGDQGILNMYFGGNWKRLDKTYNYMVGLDSVVHTVVDGDQSWYDNQLEDLPTIIHFTAGKPWHMANQNRFKDVWWFYNSIDWSDILLRSYALKGGYDSLVAPLPYTTAIFTGTAEMRDLEYLVANLSQVRVHIFAHTNFAGNIIDLQSYPNVTLHPHFNPFSKKEVLDNLNFYLDINYYGEIADIINTVHGLGKPILSFVDTNHDTQGRSQIFDSKEGLLAAAQALLQ